MTTRSLAKMLPAVLLVPLVSSAGCFLFGKMPGQSPDNPATAQAPKHRISNAEVMLQPLAADWAAQNSRELAAAYAIQDWTKNENDHGQVVRRWTRAALYLKADAEGHCRVQYCNLGQDGFAAGWGDPELNCGTDDDAFVTCDSVDALPP